MNVSDISGFGNPLMTANPGSQHWETGRWTSSHQTPVFRWYERCRTPGWLGYLVTRFSLPLTGLTTVLVRVAFTFRSSVWPQPNGWPFIITLPILCTYQDQLSHFLANLRLVLVSLLFRVVVA